MEGDYRLLFWAATIRSRILFVQTWSATVAMPIIVSARLWWPTPPAVLPLIPFEIELFREEKREAGQLDWILKKPLSSLLQFSSLLTCIVESFECSGYILLLQPIVLSDVFSILLLLVSVSTRVFWIFMSWPWLVLKETTRRWGCELTLVDCAFLRQGISASMGKRKLA